MTKRIAISSMGKNEESEVSKVSGRAPYYLIFEEGKLIKAVKNPFRIGGGGAGFSVAEMLSDEKVNLVVSGEFGRNMEGALKEKNIEYKAISGMTVKEALKKVIE